MRFTAGPDSLALWHRVEPVGKDLHTVAEFTVNENQRFPFTLVWHPSPEEPPPPLDSHYTVHLTDAFWTEWAEQCCYEGPYKEAVVRSLITLKALTYEPTGGIVAAATTSLPEALGGNRNWDYRYCWLRDATLTLESLMRGGYYTEAMAWRDWLLRAVAGDVSKLQIMYGPGGERRLEEWEASWLPGYEKSAPVRIGNAASEQYQLDVYGEVMSALYSSAKTEGVHSHAAWALQVQLIKFLETGWREPDDGIWEVRGPRRHFTHSKVMAWVAVDRAVRTLEEWPELEGPVEKWRTMRDDIFNEVCEKGYNSEVGAFTQYYGSDQLDASVLMIPLMGFLPAERPAGGEHRRSRATRSHGPRVRPAVPHRRRRRGRRADRSGRGIPRLLVLAGGLPAHDRTRGGRPGALRAALVTAQRPRPALRGVRPAGWTTGGELPPGLLPRLVDQFRLPVERFRSARHPPLRGHTSRGGHDVHAPAAADEEARPCVRAPPEGRVALSGTPRLRTRKVMET